MSITTRLTQRGDTIVEVLIAVAVVSTVLVAAISISNKSLQQIRMAQERTEAQKIAQQSVEKIGKLVITEKNTLITPPTIPNFCIPPTSYTVVTSLPNAACNTGIYETVISRTGTIATQLTFNISVSWPSLNGTIENVTINYRPK
jgi:type II secretory pathway pseudopilin PulG